MEVAFGASAAYVATVRLPAQLIRQIEQAEAPDIRITFGSTDQANLFVCDGEGFSFSCAQETGDVFDLVQEQQRSLVGIGPVTEKITVKQALKDAGGRLRRGYEQADVDKKKRQAAVVDESANMSTQSVKKTKVVTTTRNVAPQAQKPPPVISTASNSSIAERAKAPVSNGGGTSASSGRQANRSAIANGHTMKLDESLIEWCIHRLALAPRTLSALQKSMREAQVKKVLPQHLQDASLVKALAKVSTQTDDRYYILPEKLSETTLSWPHFSEDERATLQVILKQKGITPKGGWVQPSDEKKKVSTQSLNGLQRPGASLTSGLDVPKLSSEAQYREAKKKFNEQYPKYLKLDEELSAFTKRFEALEHEHANATTEVKKGEVARRLRDEFQKVESIIQRKVQEQRNLHVELKRLKLAVNQYVESHAGK